MTDKNLSLVIDFKGIDGLSNTLRVITGAGNQAEAQHRHLIKTLADERKELRQLEQVLKNVSKIDGPVGHLYSRQKQLKEQIEKTNSELKKQSRLVNEMNNAKALGNEMIGVGMGNIATGVAIGAPPALAAREAAKFETSMAGARKVLNGWSNDALKALNQDVLDLSGNIPIAAEGIAAIVAAGGQDGVGQEFADKGNFKAAREELIGFATDAAKMSVAFDIGAEEAGSRMSAWRASMGITQKEAAKLADQINALSDSKGGGNAADISEVTTRVGALAKIGGVGRQEVAAMASHLSGMKVPAEIAATGIKNMMLGLVAGDQATKSQSAAFQKLGLDTKVIAKNMQIDAKGTILDVLTKVSTLSKDQQASTLESMFGREGLLAIAPMVSQLDGLKDKFNFVGNAANFAGSMTREFNSRNETAEAQALMAKNELRALAIDMGSTLLPAIKSGSKSIKEITHGVRDWVQEHPKLTKNLMKGVLLISGFVIGVGSLRVAIGAGLSTFSSLRMGIGFLGKAFGLARVIIMPLIPLLGAISWPVWVAIGAFTVLGLVVWKNWAKIKKAFNDGINYIKSHDLGQIGMDLMLGLARGIIKGVGFVISPITGLVTKIKNSITGPMQIKSPSRWGMAQMGFLVEGFGIGIKQNSHKAINPMQNLSRRIMAAGVIAGAMTGGMAHAGIPRAPAPVYNFHLTINAGSADANEVAKMVGEEIKKIMNKANASKRADMGDYD